MGEAGAGLRRFFEQELGSRRMIGRNEKKGERVRRGQSHRRVALQEGELQFLFAVCESPNWSSWVSTAKENAAAGTVTAGHRMRPETRKRTGAETSHSRDERRNLQ